MGYFMSISIEAITLMVSAEQFLCVLIITIGFCWFISDFIADIEEHLRQLNEDLPLINTSRNMTEAHHLVRMMQNLANVIRFHGEAKELRFS